jgi:hypothetical protein
MGVIITIVSPILPFLMFNSSTTFDPNDPSSRIVYHFMSYDWFRTAGLDIAMIFIIRVVIMVILVYFQPLSFIKRLFLLLINTRSVAEHSLFTFMPNELPLIEFITHIVEMVLICSVVGCAEPVVFVMLSFYVLAFIAIESSRNRGYIGLSYINPQVFSKLALVLQISYLLFIFFSFLSLLKIFSEIKVSVGAYIFLMVLLGIFLLIFLVSMLVMYRFYNNYNFRFRQLDRYIIKYLKTYIYMYVYLYNMMIMIMYIYI